MTRNPSKIFFNSNNYNEITFNSLNNTNFSNIHSNNNNLYTTLSTHINNAPITNNNYLMNNNDIAIDTTLTINILKQYACVHSKFKEGELLLISLNYQESMANLFQCSTFFISQNHSLDSKTQLGEMISIEITASDKPFFISGIVKTFVITGIRHLIASEVFYLYACEIIHPFEKCTYNNECKIFQKKDCTAIIKDILNKYQITNKISAVKGKEVEYCVQYNENDFHFTSRLMQENGIFYFTKHEKNKCTLIVSDDKKAYHNINKIEYLHPYTYDTKTGIRTFSMRESITINKYLTTDYNYEKSQTKLSTSTSLKGSLKQEFFEYPGGYREKSDGDKLVKIRASEIEFNKVLYYGESNNSEMAVGNKFTLKNNPNKLFNEKTFVVHSINHNFNIMNYLTGNEDIYFNSFTCFQENVQYKPARTFKKNFIHGIQTAIVTGPEKDEIYKNKLGSIKVQFFWDKDGKKDEKTTCWIRVAQSMAGNAWGSLFTPRIGQEVIVQFINGDPDLPVVTGCLYNDKNIPAYNDKQLNVNGLMTKSTKDAKGFNEFRFNDTKAKEEIFLRAQKDMVVQILNSRTTNIGGSFNNITLDHGSYGIKLLSGKSPVLKDDSIQSDNKGSSFSIAITKGDYKIDIKEGSHISELTKGNRQFTISQGNSFTNLDKGNMKITLKKGNLETKVKGNYILDIDGDINIKASGSILVKSTKKTNFNAIDSFTIVGKEVNLQSKMNFNIQAGMNLACKSGQKIDIKSGMDTQIKAGMNLKLLGGINSLIKAGVGVKVEGGVNAEIKGGVMLDLKAGGVVSVTGVMTKVGSIVKLG